MSITLFSDNLCVNEIQTISGPSFKDHPKEQLDYFPFREPKDKRVGSVQFIRDLNAET